MASLTNDSGGSTVDALLGDPLHLTRHQIDSYNNFVDYVLPSIVEQYKPFRIVRGTPAAALAPQWFKAVWVRLEKPHVGESVMTPTRARTTRSTYEGKAMVKFGECTEKGVLIIPDNTSDLVCIGRIPIMVGSNRCNGAGGRTAGGTT